MRLLSLRRGKGRRSDGEQAGRSVRQRPVVGTDPGLAFTTTIPGPPCPGSRFGKLAEVRLWGCALSNDGSRSIATILTGNEPGLRAYYAMRAPVAGLVHRHTETDPDGKADRRRVPGLNPPIGNPGSGVLACDGLSDYVTLPAIRADFRLGLTIEAWIPPGTRRQSGRCRSLIWEMAR